MSIRFSQLEEFCTFCEYMNFTVAAKKLFTTQSNLSKSVHRLESETGLTLIRQHKKRLVLTNAGAHFLNEASRIVSSYNTAVEQCQEIQCREDLPISVFTPFYQDTTCRLYYQRIAKITEIFPNCTIQYITPNRVGIFDAIAREDADAAVAYQANPAWKPQDSRLASIKLTDVRLAIWCRDDHPLADRNVISVEMLRGIPIMRPNDAISPLASPIEALCANKGFEPIFNIVNSQEQTQFYFMDPKESIYILPLSSQFDMRIASQPNRKIIPLENEPLCSSFIVYRKELDERFGFSHFLEDSAE